MENLNVNEPDVMENENNSGKEKKPPFRRLTNIVGKSFLGRKYDELRNFSVRKMQKYDSGLNKKQRIIYYGSFLFACLILFFGSAFWKIEHPKSTKIIKYPVAKAFKDTSFETQIKQMKDSIKAHRVFTIEDKKDAEIIKRLAEAASASFKDLPDSLKSK